MPEDLNQLFWYEEQELIPRLVPKYYPYAPLHEPAFEVYRAQASQLGVTTLNTFVAPAPPQWKQDLGQTQGISGNGIVFTGNAPSSGVYTGVQQE